MVPVHWVKLTSHTSRFQFKGGDQIADAQSFWWQNSEVAHGPSVQDCGMKGDCESGLELRCQGLTRGEGELCLRAEVASFHTI